MVHMTMDIAKALAQGGIADMTTVGRKSGLPRRIEIYFHNLDGVLYIGGRPGRKRDWLANLVANPAFTLHLKRGVSADLPTRAIVVSDPDERQGILFRMLTESWGSDPDKARQALPVWVEQSPLIRFETATGA